MQGLIYLLIATLIYSIMPLLIRVLGSSGIPPLSQVFLRYIVAFATATLYFLFTTKKKITLQKKYILIFLIVTIYGYALTNAFYTYAILYTQISNVLFLFFSFAIIAPIMGLIILKDKLNQYNWIALVLTFIALLLLFQPNAISTWKLGGVFAILSAIGQALYVVLRKKLPAYPANFMMFANTGLGVVTVGILAFFLEQSFYTSGAIGKVSLNGWLITILFGVLNFGAWFTLTKGFEYVNAATGSMVLLLELLLGVIFAFFFFQEIPTMLTLTGGALITIASIMVIKKGVN